MRDRLYANSRIEYALSLALALKGRFRVSPMIAVEVQAAEPRMPLSSMARSYADPVHPPLDLLVR